MVSMGRDETTACPLMVHVLLSPVGAGRRGSPTARHAGVIAAAGLCGPGAHAQGPPAPVGRVRLGADRPDAALDGVRTAGRAGAHNATCGAGESRAVGEEHVLTDAHRRDSGFLMTP